MAQLFLILVSSLALHPFHVSVCDIEVNAENKSLEISQRIFLDDLENALRKTSGWSTLDIAHPSDQVKFDAILKNYVTSHLSISINGQVETLNYLGYEIEGDAMWCYVEITKVKKVKDIGVKSTILLDSFEDQMNLVHIKKDGETHSLRLNKSHEKDAIFY